jgi:hypothetical protein
LQFKKEHFHSILCRSPELEIHGLFFRFDKTFFEPKFTCSRTKVEAITKHVISTWANEEVTEEKKKKLHL